MSDAFVVAIKPSARRTNGAVGRLVNREGSRHGFADREAAEEWAEGLAAAGERRVWVRAANPNDPAAVDAYLVGRTRDPRSTGDDGARQADVDGGWGGGDDPPAQFPERSSAVRTVDAAGDPGTQASMTRFDPDEAESDRD